MRWVQTAAAINVSALAALFATSSLAQTPASQASSQTDVEEVVVTGSRIARRDYVSESPIVTLPSDQLEKSGAVTVEDALNLMPQFASSSNSTSNNGNSGQANADLRGLGPKRTLVLLDGRRLQPSGTDGAVDLNIIPMALISGVEIISGGASAIYGSDAITGVVNFKRKRNIDGLEVTAQYGQTERGDGINGDVSVALGGDFAEDRGNAVLGLSYSKREPVFSRDRDFFAISGFSGNLPQGIVRAVGSNLPTQAAVNAVFAKYGIAPGTVPRGNTFGFNTDGTLFSVARPAVNARDDLGLYQVTRNNTYFTNTGDVNYLQLPLTRYAVYGHADYELTPHIKTYLQGTYTNYHSKSNQVPIIAGGLQGPINVPVTNPFIPEDLRAILASRPNPNATWVFSKQLLELGRRNTDDGWNVYQFLIGASGDVPGRDWTWDVYVSRGESQHRVVTTGFGSLRAIQDLLNAPDGGRSLCTGGYNFFGLTKLSDSCLNYLSRTVQSSTDQAQTDAQATLQGGLFKLPAGEVRFAAGGEVRRNSFDFRPDSAQVAGELITASPTTPASGKVTVAEVYGELLVPLLRDLPLVQELNLDVAARYSHYDTVGGIETYKASLDWKPADWLRVRGAYQRAIRAPNLAELFTGSSVSSENLPAIGPIGTGDPCDIRTAYRAAGQAGASQVRALCIAQGVPAPVVDSFVNTNVNLSTRISGNPDLSPEKGDTLTVGAVFTSPSSHPLLANASLSVDYYSISLDKAIGEITGLLTLSKCFNADGSNPSYSNDNFFCGLIFRDPQTGLPDRVQTPLVNLGGYRSRGVDFQLDWRAELSDLGFGAIPGEVSINSVVTYLDTFKIQTLPNTPFQDYAGTIGNTQINAFNDTHPHWKAVTTAGYVVGPVRASLRWRYIEGMSNASNVGTTGTARGVKSRNYYDLDAAWKVTPDLQLSGGVINLLDEIPPLFGATEGTTSRATYDVLGRRFYVRLAASF